MTIYHLVEMYLKITGISSEAKYSHVYDIFSVWDWSYYVEISTKYAYAVFVLKIDVIDINNIPT
jgi:hypothetical protein